MQLFICDDNIFLIKFPGFQTFTESFTDVWPILSPHYGHGMCEGDIFPFKFTEGMLDSHVNPVSVPLGMSKRDIIVDIQVKIVYCLSFQ